MNTGDIQIPQASGLLSNLYYNSGWKYAANGYGNAITFDNGNVNVITTPNNSSGAGAVAAVTTRLFVSSSGRIGINTSTPTFDLELANDSAAKPSTSNWTVISDVRVKENIQNYSKGLETIINLNPVTYDYNGKAGYQKIKNNIGLIAQEVLEILPESISIFRTKLNQDDEQETQLYNFNSHALTYVLVNSVKQLKQENDELKNTLNEVLARLSALENK